MIVYPQDRLYQEMAYIAYHFHWPYAEILNMEHHERQRWVDEITSINTNLNAIAEDAAAYR
jgi:hypothetical protein